MELDKAIQLSTEVILSLKNAKFHDHADAVQLGIEALHRHALRHHLSYADLMLPLTRETPPAASHDILPPTRFGVLIGYARGLIHPNYDLP